MQKIDAMRTQDYELQLLLSTMLQSSAFALAERVSRLRQGGKPMFSRAQVAAALDRVSEDNDLLRQADNGSAPSQGNGRSLDLDVEDPGFASGAA